MSATPRTKRSRKTSIHELIQNWKQLEKAELIALLEGLPPGLEPADVCRTPRILEPSDLDTQVELSATELDEELMCPICMSTFRTVAVVKDCMHRFCEECIERWLRIGHQACPKCRRKIPSRRSLRNDPIFQLVIERVFPTDEPTHTRTRRRWRNSTED